MKLHRISIAMLVALLFTASCNDIDNQEQQTGDLTADQSAEAVEDVPSRSNAAFAGLFNLMGKPCAVRPANERPDDFGFIMSAISLDLEGADMAGNDNGYNWLSTASEYSSRNPNYANPTIRYQIAYMVIGAANEILASIPAETTSETLINQMAQARAVRAYAYLFLAPYFQARYVDAKDKPCVPILESSTDFTNNPRATVEQVYNYILEDLNYAVEHLEGYVRPDKSRVDQNVAYGLRARAYLNMGKYAEAAADAEKAMKGYTPASMADVSKPAFCNMATESNWIWGINITSEMIVDQPYATAPSWMSAFAAENYAAGTDNLPMINKLLYNQISKTDVRHNWWLDENRHTPNWADIEWKDGSTVLAKGDAIADLTIKDVKMKYSAYSNVKFGMKNGGVSSVNDSDWPTMRVEEMILVNIEGLAKSGHEAEAKQKLIDFVKTYRDPEYTFPNPLAPNRNLEDEIWFQRRVELWGEGFFVSDARRLDKPIVRFHDNYPSNFSAAFQFNIKPNDEWLNLRFPKTETNNNLAVVNNEGGSQPVAGQNGELRDGVTNADGKTIK